MLEVGRLGCRMLDAGRLGGWDAGCWVAGMDTAYPLDTNLGC